MASCHTHAPFIASCHTYAPFITAILKKQRDYGKDAVASYRYNCTLSA